MDIEQIKLERVSHGLTFDARPHFIASAKKDMPPIPGFYIEDIRSEKVYTGYLKGLNERDISENQTYKMIIRGIGDKLKDYTYQLFLEERVENGNQIHFQVEDFKEGDEHKLVGGFLDYSGRKPNYLAFVKRKSRINGEIFEIYPDDFVFGSVSNVDKNNRILEMNPISIVNEKRYLKHKNRIFRAS